MNIKQFLEKCGKWMPFTGFVFTVQSAYVTNLECKARLARELEEKAKTTNETIATEFENMIVNQDLQNKLSSNVLRMEESRAEGQRSLEKMQEYISKLNKTTNSEEKSAIIQNIEYHLQNYNTDLKNYIEQQAKIQEILDQTRTKNSSVIDLDFLKDLFTKFQEYLQTLSLEQQVYLSNIFGSIFILACIFSLASIFFGDLFILYFNLEARFPKIAKYIELRRRFKKYYFIMNLIFIVIMLLTIIWLNLYFFFQ